MKKRQGIFVHPFLCEPKAGEREIRMRPGKSALIMRGKEENHAE